jgi:hypothetical protein
MWSFHISNTSLASSLHGLGIIKVCTTSSYIATTATGQLGNYFANSAIYRAASANTAAAPPTTHCAFPVIFGTPAVLELEDPVATVPEPLVELAVVLPDAELPVFDAVPVVEAAVLAPGSAPPVSVTICLVIG